MEKLVIASIRKSAGKSSLSIGLGKALNKKLGYIKPLGDRLIYHEKRLWDYDSSLLAHVFGLKDPPEEITIGFHHSKLRYMYDRETTRKKLSEIAARVSADKDLLLIEAGQDLTYGASVFLDGISLAEHLECKMVLVISGDDDTIMDDIVFLQKHMDLHKDRLLGIVINKVHDVEDFKISYLPAVKNTGIPVLGLLPFYKELTYFSAHYLSETMLAKVIAGEAGLNKVIKNTFVGALPVDEAVRSPAFKKENNLLITSGDRSDLVVAALESDFSAIMLTNNIQPPSNIINNATLLNIPVLLVASDTYHVARAIDTLESLITDTDSAKISLLELLTKNNLDLQKIA